MCICKESPDEIDVGFGIFMSKMRNVLIEIWYDGYKWDRVFKCEECNQLWYNYYTAGGHGEVAHLKKISENQAKAIIPKECFQTIGANDIAINPLKP